MTPCEPAHVLHFAPGDLIAPRLWILSSFRSFTQFLHSAPDDWHEVIALNSSMRALVIYVSNCVNSDTVCWHQVLVSVGGTECLRWFRIAGDWVLV